MSPVDGCLLAFAVVDGLAVVGMGTAGWLLLKTAKRAQGQLQPAIQEVQAVVGLGKAMADHARTDGRAAFERVKAVTGAVRRRVETTRRIVRELKPAAQETALAVQETVGEKQADLARTSAAVGDLGKRLGRLRAATQAALDAARRPDDAGR